VHEASHAIDFEYGYSLEYSYFAARTFDSLNIELITGIAEFLIETAPLS